MIEPDQGRPEDVPAVTDAGHIPETNDTSTANDATNLPDLGQVSHVRSSEPSGPSGGRGENRRLVTLGVVVLVLFAMAVTALLINPAIGQPLSLVFTGLATVVIAINGRGSGGSGPTPPTA